MATIRFILRKDKKNAKGEYPVVLRVADSDNSRVHISTGFFSSDKYFDAGKGAGRFYQGRGIPAFTLTRKEESGGTKVYTNREANNKLGELENRAKSILSKYEESHINWSMEQFKNDFINKPKRELFYTFAESAIETEYTARGQYGTATIAKAALKSLLDFDKQLKKRHFQDINIKYLNDYIAHCIDTKHQKNNTISIRLREIRRLFNIAIRDKVIDKDLYPFNSGKSDGKVKIPSKELNKTDQYLSIDSMKKIARTTLSDPILERTRHLFLFSYYCQGINWRDMALLTKDNFHKVTVTDTTTKAQKQQTVMVYKRAKTKKLIEILVDENIQRELDWFKENSVLLDKYVLPIMSVNVAPDKFNGYISQIRKRLNRSLKELAKQLELPEGQDDLSIYTARHSFAMTLQDKGKSVEIISQALGHQSVETTKHYLAKFSTTKMAEETHIDLLND